MAFDHHQLWEAVVGDVDLLPCPCCGNDRPQREPRTVDADDWGNRAENGGVFCRNCGLRLETCHGQKEAERRWNARCNAKGGA